MGIVKPGIARSREHEEILWVGIIREPTRARDLEVATVAQQREMGLGVGVDEGSSNADDLPHVGERDRRGFVVFARVIANLDIERLAASPIASRTKQRLG